LVRSAVWARSLTCGPQIRDSAGDVIYKLSQMKFESPNTQSEEEITGKFEALYNEIGETFRRLQE